MVLERIASIFLIMAIGFTARKVKAVDGTFLRGLSAFMMNIALPFAFMASLDRSIPKSTLPELVVMLLWSIGVHLVSIAFAAVVWKGFPEGRRRVLCFITVFTNSAFMGIPVAQGVAGTKGVMFAAVYNLVYAFLIYTYGISLFQDKALPGRWKRVFLNPGTVAILIGLVIWLLPFALPGFVTEGMNLMAKLQTPLAMFVVGANIASIDLKRLTSWRDLALASLVRLAVLPLGVYAAIRLSGLTGTAAAITLLMTAMPAGAQSVVVAEQQGGDSAFASEIVFATTILSILTIPLFATLSV